MMSAFLLADPENSRILRVNVGTGRLKRAARAAATAATVRHQAHPGGPGAPQLPAVVQKAPAGSWLSEEQAAFVLQDPDRHGRTFKSPCADTSRINVRITTRSSPV